MNFNVALYVITANSSSLGVTDRKFLSPKANQLGSMLLGGDRERDLESREDVLLCREW